MEHQPESVDDWLRGKSALSGLEREKDLSFTLDPTKIRKRLAETVAAEPFIWLIHLLQWCRHLGPKGFLVVRKAGNGLDIKLGPIPEFLESEVSPTTPSPLSDSPISELARLKMEMELFQPETIFFDDDPLHFNLKSQGQRTLSYARSALLDPSSPHSAFLWAETRFENDLMEPEWRAPWLPAEQLKKAESGVFDFETFELAKSSSGAFPWRVYRLARRCGELAPNLVFHFLRRQRGFCSGVVLGSYAPRVLKTLSPRGKMSFTRWPIKRVLGVCWEAKNQCPAQLRPVIRGYLGEPIFLPNFPSGILVYAEASQLDTDFSGVRLVQNSNYQNWLNEQLDWSWTQLRNYVPLALRAREHRYERDDEYWRLGSSLRNRRIGSAWTRLFRPRDTKALLEREAELQSFVNQRDV